MTVWITVEGDSDQTILKSLLPKEIQAVSSIISTGGRSNILSVARTLLVKHREPVVVLRDADSSDPEVARERYVDSELLVRAASGGTPFRVVLCVPEIEAIFFTNSDILKRVFPSVDHETHRLLYKTQPKEALAFLLAQGGGPATLIQFLHELTEVDRERMRTAGPLKELIAFVREVVGPTGKQTTS